MQPPQPAPALVAAFTSPAVVQPPSTAPQIWPFVTVSHEQTERVVAERVGADHRATAGGSDEAGRVVGARQVAGRHGREGGVGAGVADEDAAAHGAGVGIDREPLVDVTEGVVPDEGAGARAVPLRVAERGDVDAEELELGREVGALEGPVLAVQSSGGQVGHAVAGRDEPVAAAAVCRDLPDRPHLGVAGRERVVDVDTPTLGHLEPAGAGEVVPRTDPGGDHHQLGIDALAVGDLQPGHWAGGIVGDADHLLGGEPAVHLDAELLDPGPQGSGAALVELGRHELGRELDDVGVEPEETQGVRCLQAEQAAAHDDPAADVRSPRPGVDGLEVVDRPVHEHARTVGAGHRRHEGTAAGREHQAVVGDLVAAGGQHDSPGPVDGHDLVADPHVDAALVEEAGLDHRQRVGVAVVEPRRQPDPVVGGAGLVAEGRDLEAPGEAALGEALEEALADHAVADDHDPIAGVQCGGSRHGAQETRRALPAVSVR